MKHLSVLKLLTATAFAATMWLSLPSADAQTGRYMLKQAGNGVVRLDTETGALSPCTEVNNEWTCGGLANDSDALEKKVHDLTRENEAMKRKIASLEKQLKAAKNDQDSIFGLPSDKDIDRMMTFMENIMRRFFAFAKSLREETQEL